MTNVDIPQATEERAEKISTSEAAESPSDIRTALIRLDADETIWREKAEDYRKKARVELDSIRTRLESLETTSPDASDLDDLFSMYQDLEKDFQREATLDLDQSFASITEEALREIEGNGVEVVLPEDVVDSELRSRVEELAQLGLRIDYVVPAPVTSAPTIILIPQIHYNSGMSQEMMKTTGILESQQDIEDTALLLHDHGVSSTVFMEGLSSGYILNEEEAAENINHGVARAKLALGDGLEVIGFDDFEFVRKALIEIDKSTVSALRVTANNIALADNVVHELDKSTRNTALLLIGALHEVTLSKNAAHPFPLSKVLASEGVNVIVTNVPRKDSAALTQWMAENQEEVARVNSQTKGLVVNKSG